MAFVVVVLAFFVFIFKFFIFHLPTRDNKTSIKAFFVIGFVVYGCGLTHTHAVKCKFT